LMARALPKARASWAETVRLGFSHNVARVLKNEEPGKLTRTARANSDIFSRSSLVDEVLGERRPKPERRGISLMMSSMRSTGFFTRFAKWTSRAAGQPAAFAIAVATLLLWAVSGPIFGFSDTWQLIINTGTTIVTFLMVFLIQNTQNRDAEALHVKLDELIRATKAASNALLDIEDLEEEDLDKIRADYEALAARARRELNRRSKNR
jgi:low affinity Fe/Cu permease